MEITQDMTISEKLKILTDAAKYDVACTSSGVDRSNKGQGIGDTHALRNLSYFFGRWKMCIIA